MKIAGSIKPEKLRGTDTPQSFCSWKKNVKSYFETGRLDRLNLDEQHAVIRALIDVELEEVVGDRLDPAMPMFAPAGDDGGECVITAGLLHHAQTPVIHSSESFSDTQDDGRPYGGGLEDPTQADRQ